MTCSFDVGLWRPCHITLQPTAGLWIGCLCLCGHKVKGGSACMGCHYQCRRHRCLLGKPKWAQVCSKWKLFSSWNSLIIAGMWHCIHRCYSKKISINFWKFSAKLFEHSITLSINLHVQLQCWHLLRQQALLSPESVQTCLKKLNTVG